VQPNKNNAKVGPSAPRVVRCAIYARKSTEEGLAQPFNSLDAQRESAEAYISSHWRSTLTGTIRNFARYWQPYRKNSSIRP